MGNPAPGLPEPPVAPVRYGRSGVGCRARCRTWHSRWATPLPAGGDRVVDDAGRAARLQARALRFYDVSRILRRSDAGPAHAEARVRRGGRECRTGDDGQSAQRGSALPAVLAGSPGPSAELLREHSGPDLDGGGAESTGDEQL